MQGIELKEFQINCVNKLLDATTVGNKKEILVQAPTGSGKTIILLDYIQEYIEENKNTIFVWLTPGKGDLEEQSRDKMTKYLPSMNSKNINDILLSGFEAGDTAFINWETITKKGNTALKEAERKNLFERIDEAYNRGYNFIVIVDEEHLNKTVKAEAIIDYLKPNYIVRVSATTKKNKEAEFIQIDELDVINEGLITRALYINENVGNNIKLENEHEYLLDLALEKQKAIRKEYKNNSISVNPLIIIQVPSKSDELIEQIETLLDNKGYSYKNKAVAIWLADRKENIENIIRAVFGLEKCFHILIVEDNSPDGTADIVRKLQAEFPERLFMIERKGKLGLGTAYIAGFKWAIQHQYDYIFEMDADFSHNPNDLPRLYKACHDEGADVAIGSRYISGVNVVNWPMGRVLMSYFASKYVRFITGIPVHDTTAGFKCYKRRVLETIPLDNIRFKGYAFQIEMKFTAYKCGFKVVEVPVIFVNRELGTSKMNSSIFGEAVFGVIRLKWDSWFKSYPKNK